MHLYNFKFIDTCMKTNGFLNDMILYFVRGIFLSSFNATSIIQNLNSAFLKNFLWK